MDKNLRTFICVGVESAPCGIEFVGHHLRGKVGEPRCDTCGEEHKASSADLILTKDAFKEPEPSSV
jgi:hypothetical protein